MVSVVLFRSATAPEDEDKYHKELSSHGFCSTSVPVLSFEFENLDKLGELISDPQAHGGMILTSQRGVEAMEMCIKSTISIDAWNENIQTQWKEHPVFVVGMATSKATSEKLGLQSIGHEAGSAELLVPIILEVVKNETKPLLFPCGNLRKETIPVEMKKAGIALSDVQVYKTFPHPDISKALRKYIEMKGVPSVVVFFSPSGVENTIDVLKEFIDNFSKIKMVAVGNTTCKAMNDKGLPVCGVAEKPTPQALSRCIKQCLV